MEVQKLVNERFFLYGGGGRRQGDSGTLQRGFVLWQSSVAAAHKEELLADAHGGVSCFSCR